MLYQNTLSEIGNNVNTGVEYEIALFYKLLPDQGEKDAVMSAIELRADRAKVLSIIEQTDISQVLEQLKCRGLNLLDVSFETQNDEVGPSDLVMYLRGARGERHSIGLSVKYANTCTLNVTGKRFITDVQLAELKELLPEYTSKYLKEMTAQYGAVGNWFRQRKPSAVTDQYIDLIRDAVICSWPHIQNKSELLATMFHANSPIEFWVVTYDNRGYTLMTTPATIDVRYVNDVTVKKYRTSFVAFYLNDIMLGKMQVKFNNGFVEKCKKKNPDIVYQNTNMAYGKPFSSWNFSVEK